MIREATLADEATIRELWQAFEAELPEPEGFRAESWEEDWRDVADHVERGVVLLWEDEEGVAGYVRFAPPEHGRSHLAVAYVRPRARRRGVLRALVREGVARLRGRGVEWISLDVLALNEPALAAWSAFGFREVLKRMVAPLAEVEARTAERPRGRTFGSVHVQTDDAARVRTAVARFVPRLGRSAGTEVSEARNGWVAVYDELCDREPANLHRLAGELSNTVGAPALALGVEQGAVVRYGLYERGSAVDEYLSVPQFYGELPPGDVIALGANPTVVARLTGADPARIRSVARTAARPEELPPAEELLREVAAAIGVEGAERGWVESGA